MVTLGFDPSLTAFGWALVEWVENRPKLLERGRFSTDASQVFVDRYVQQRERLRQLIQRTGCRRISCEYPVFKELYSEGMFGLFLYASEAFRTENCDVVVWSPMQVKQHARRRLGRPLSWKMDKTDMVEAARLDSGDRSRWDHNEADAYWVARVGGRFWALHAGDLATEDLDEVERQHFVSMRTITRGPRAGVVERKGVLYREDDRFFLWSEGHGEKVQQGGKGSC